MEMIFVEIYLDFKIILYILGDVKRKRIFLISQ
jgi:hypothetical protein